MRRKEIGNQCICRRRQAGLANAHAHAAEEVDREAACGARKGCERAPHRDSTTEHQPTITRVRQATEGNADQCVEQHECGGEAAQLPVAELPFLLDLLADRPDHLAVVEVHEVQREEHRQCIGEPSLRGCRIIHRRGTHAALRLRAAP